MMHGSQSQQDVSGLIKPLIHPKYNMTYSREEKARGRLEVMGGGADHSNQSRGVEKLCEGSMCHKGTKSIGEGCLVHSESVFIVCNLST